MSKKTIASMIEEAKTIVSQYGKRNFSYVDKDLETTVDGTISENGVTFRTCDGGSCFYGWTHERLQDDIERILDDVKESIEPIEKLKKIAEEHGNVSFTIEDNCPGDGWDGTLTEKGIYMFGNNHFEGEFFKWNEEEVENWADDVLDAVMAEIDEDDEEEGTASENIEEDADPSLKKNSVNDYEPLTTLRLDGDFKRVFPIAFQNKVDELIEQGLAKNEDEAEEIMKDMEVELELYYEKDRGFFAVETEAVECSPIFSPYTKKELWDE